SISGKCRGNAGVSIWNVLSGARPIDTVLGRRTIRSASSCSCANRPIRSAAAVSCMTHLLEGMSAPARPRQSRNDCAATARPVGEVDWAMAYREPAPMPAQVFVCIPCGKSAPAPGTCAHCGDTLLDAAREDVRELIDDI